MKRRVLILVVVATALVGTTAFAAQSSAQATANATARIITAISIVKNVNGDLNFGDVVPSGAVGTVTVTPAGVRTSAGGATLGNGTAVTAASFTVSGQSSATYAITLPASINVTSGANTMSVDTFTSNPAGTGALSVAGSQTLTVGANLNVGVNQPPGTYTGTFTVTVAYN